MSYIQGAARNQAVLFPEVIDEYITEDNPVRFLDAFVDSLDLKARGFARSEPAETGRPAYYPGDLLKLYIYGYLNRVRSSRRLEQETHRNVEVLWLLKKLQPDFKTIADFRRDNTKAFKGVFRQFTMLCHKLDLFGKELVAVDGSKFKAVNSKGRNFTEGVLEKRLKEIDEKIDRYLKQLDEADEQEARDHRPAAEGLKEKIAYLKDRKHDYELMQHQMAEEGKTQISLTDPDSRAYPQKFKVGVGYNVQTAVDDKYHLIVEQDVTNAILDMEQLSGIAIRAKETLGIDTLKVAADAGYCNAEEVKVCEESGIEAYTPRIPTSTNRKKGRYTKDAFRYDLQEDCYYCPVGEKLRFRFQRRDKWRNKWRQVRYYEGKSCTTCQYRRSCTERPTRRIMRTPEGAAIDRMYERMRAHPEIMGKRKMIAEHPYGTIKFWNDQGCFLMRGLEKVRAEFSLSTLAYNIKRVINILGVQRTVKAPAY